MQSILQCTAAIEQVALAKALTVQSWRNSVNSLVNCEEYFASMDLPLQPFDQQKSHCAQENFCLLTYAVIRHKRFK